MMYNELIKALRNCEEHGNGGDCRKECPYVDRDCGICNHEVLLHDAADAIERLQADLAKKDSQLAEWKNAWRIANSLYKSAQSEIDELRAYERELVERIETLKAEFCQN